MVDFSLDAKQLEQFEEWNRGHCCEYTKPNSCGAIGGRLTYQFTPTGLGVITEIICACGGSCDVTDDNW